MGVGTVIHHNHSGIHLIEISIDKILSFQPSTLFTTKQMRRLLNPLLAHIGE